MTPTASLPDRRRRRLLSRVLALGGAALLQPLGAAAQERALRATPAVALGPFYPDVMPSDRDADLTTVAGRPGRAAGQVLYVTGRVLDTRGRPLPGAMLELWQANVHGRYTHTGDTDASGPLDPAFQGYGALSTAEDGSYRIKTIKPAPYSGRTPHIHFNAAAAGTKLTTQMFFEGEKMNERDGLYRWLGRDDRRAATGRYVDRGPGMEAQALAVSWDIVLKT